MLMLWALNVVFEVILEFFCSLHDEDFDYQNRSYLFIAPEANSGLRFYQDSCVPLYEKLGRKTNLYVYMQSLSSDQ
jgi:hypothetical protein